jgi:capsule polysaccharide export protein KpsE/RkpR
MLLILVRNRGSILAVLFIALVLGAGIALLMTPAFTASATILPPQTPPSMASALVGQIGASAVTGGGTSNLPENPPNMYIGILQSRTIADNVIERFHLQARWKLGNLEDTRKALKERAQFETAKNGLIVITVEDREPRLTSDLANAFVDELYQQNSRLAATEAAQRRSFFYQQLTEEKKALSDADEDLRKTQEKTGLIALSRQTTQSIQNVAEIRAAITAAEVELQTTRTFATDQNSNLIRLQRQVDALYQQLRSLENSHWQTQRGDIELPAARYPAEGLEYLRKYREVKYRESLFGLLSGQYEAGRIDEAKSAPNIQVVDRAVLPDKRSGPPRMLMILGFGFIGFCVACLGVFANQAFIRFRRIPDSAAKLDQLSEALHVHL